MKLYAVAVDNKWTVETADGLRLWVRSEYTSGGKAYWYVHLFTNVSSVEVAIKNGFVFKRNAQEVWARDAKHADEIYALQELLK